VDGVHEAAWKGGQVAVSLGAVPSISRHGDVDRIFNGSPHELVWVQDPDAIEIMSEGPRRAHHSDHGTGGTNVNFLCVRDGEVHMRTFERGVEAETLSCGTGVVAAALSALARDAARAPVHVRTRGGHLTVDAERAEHGGWEHIRLTGPVRHVFDGAIPGGWSRRHPSITV
jgi:diaminopimelate epimerase